MTRTPLENLIDFLKEDKVIPVIGAGVSHAIADLPGWRGAIENGFSYAETRKLGDQYINIGRKLLQDNLLPEAADVLKKLLGAPNHPFSNWLKELFIETKAKKLDLLNSIHDLCTPIILTTNYDNLLYSNSNLKTKDVFDWTNYKEVSNTLNNDKANFILHIHGQANKPETIILGSNDYKKLAEELGYKDVLKRLWSQYHFLFIGCSKDGVMDDDFKTVITFLNKWFSTNTHQHFILLNDSDIKKGHHITLLRDCNVDTINIGSDYSILPDFINALNPNREKILQNSLKLKKEVEESVERQLRLPNGNITANSIAINKLLKETLPKGIYWIDSLQLKFLEESLANINKEIKSKKEKFIFYQSIVKELVKISEVQKSIKLWNKHRYNPAALNNDDFINLAILCHECLGRIPKDILEEIRHRAVNAIHDYYYNGYLSRFVIEYKNIKNNRKEFYKDIYDSDSYFFENLKRIIASLEGVLELSANDLFPEIIRSSITPQLEKPFLLFVKGDEISIREQKHPYKRLACLNGEKSLPFEDAEIVVSNKKTLILGHTSQKCFYWDPTIDLSPNYFYTAETDKTIRQLFVVAQEPELVIKILTGQEIITFTNFKMTSSSKVTDKFSKLIFNANNEVFYGFKYLADNEIGTILYKVDRDGECLPLIKNIDLYNRIKDISIVKENIATWPSSGLNWQIRISKIEITRWEGEDLLGIRGKIGGLKNLSFLLFIKIFENDFQTVCCILIPNKLTSAFDTIVNGNNVDLVIGHLATGNYPKYLIQVIKSVNIQDTILVGEENYFLESDGNANSDILDVVAVSNKCVYALQNGSALHKINILNGRISTIKNKGIFKVINIL